MVVTGSLEESTVITNMVCKTSEGFTKMVWRFIFIFLHEINLVEAFAMCTVLHLLKPGDSEFPNLGIADGKIASLFYI